MAKIAWTPNKHQIIRSTIAQLYPQALQTYNQILQKYSPQPEVYLGIAQTLDAFAEQQKSNSLLKDALDSYFKYLQFGHIISNHSEYRQIAERCLDRMRFLGKIPSSILTN